MRHFSGGDASPVETVVELKQTEEKLAAFGRNLSQTWQKHARASCEAAKAVVS